MRRRCYCTRRTQTTQHFSDFSHFLIQISRDPRHFGSHDDGDENKACIAFRERAGLRTSRDRGWGDSTRCGAQHGDVDATNWGRVGAGRGVGCCEKSMGDVDGHRDASLTLLGRTIALAARMLGCDAKLTNRSWITVSTSLAGAARDNSTLSWTFPHTSVIKTKKLTCN